MSIPFVCPECGKPLSAANAMAGRKARCTGCNAPVVIPTGDEAILGSDDLEPVALDPDELLQPPELQALTPIIDAPPAAPVAETLDKTRPPVRKDRGLMFGAAKSLHDEDLIDMTAMVDIVFFILIFFLVTSLQAVQSVLNMPKPEALANSKTTTTVAQMQSDPNSLVVKIEEDDTILIDDEPVFGNDALRLTLKQARDERPSEPSVLVIGSPDASHGAAVKVLDACASANLASVRFFVESDEDE